MKISFERHTVKGLFGKTYYKSAIQVTLQPEEKEVARQQNILKVALLGGKDLEEEEAAIAYICRKLSVTMKDLERGIVAKVRGESELRQLSWFENQVRQRCRDFKSLLESVATSQENFLESLCFEEEI
ncbi:hypothetical protein IQ235_17740 [Oscillatoriales cyanobacterium LEGE 11467]|uniref:Uncharacterized protein n=1 Tax=Zarconia navalis LEGE 11467 TaxID=1828826 RepID=A0A928ZAE4_9CYAN|nr:hypothetical protein [Zarconia navalis]MBE9042608.1 hypothetical protein [Zarconia navalis LEGE 11467]